MVKFLIFGSFPFFMVVCLFCRFFSRSCKIWKGFWGKFEYILKDEFFIHFTGLLEQFLALNSSLDLWRKWSNLGKLNDNLVFFILFSSCLEDLFVLILLRNIHKLHWDNLAQFDPSLSHFWRHLSKTMVKPSPFC